MVDKDQVLRMFSEDKSQARRLYRAYMSDSATVKKEDIYNTVGQRILGDEKFVEAVMERSEERIEGRKKKHEYSLAEITKALEQMKGITQRQMRGKNKDRNISVGRKLVSLVAKEYKYKGREIAAYLRKDPSVITRYLKEDDDLKSEMERVFETLNSKI